MNLDGITWEEPGPTEHDLLKDIRKALPASFTYLQSWGWSSPANTPEEREAVRQDRERAIQTYLETLPESHKAILADYLTERRKQVERHASPYGAWYLFTLREARSMFAGSGYVPEFHEIFHDTVPPDSEREWFARRFLEKWNTDGERQFSLEEWEELQFVRSEEYQSKEITLAFGIPMQYTWKHEFDFYLETWYQILNRYGTLFESGFLVTLKENPELFRDYQEIRRAAEYFLTAKQETSRNPVSIEDHFRQFEHSIGHECDRLSLVEWEQVKRFADTINDPLERVDFLKRIADLPDDGTTNSSVNGKTCSDGRLLHRRNQEDVINPVNSERNRLLVERFNFDRLVRTASGIKDLNNRLKYLLEEKGVFFDYNPSVLSGMIEPDKQQFFFGIKEKIEITKGRIEAAKGGEIRRKHLTESITQNMPLILQDLSTDSRFDQIRAFLNGLEQHDGKLLWPNDPHRGRIPKPERIRKYDLPLLLHHLVQKEGLPESYSSHAFATTMFLWRDCAEIQAKELRKKLNESNDKVEDLPPGRVTDMIRRFYSS